MRLVLWMRKENIGEWTVIYTSSTMRKARSYLVRVVGKNIELSGQGGIRTVPMFSKS